ncbi:hypothetical protein [Actinoplanes sandaracinus]|uniref:hypothetical protein n=1 Tax=Actinoplanes sandaracinus TaxID=3045177 RepID=UPI0024A82027|nr:hypothetical protein [Actinoplanes sandaracinus]
MNQTLCAATHVTEGFADYTAHIFDGGPRGGAPYITEDPVALLRHAVTAKRSRSYRDVVCALVAVAIFATVVGRLADPLGHPPAVVTVVALIAGWRLRQRIRHALRTWCAWAWRSKWDRRQPGPLRWVAGVACAALLAAVVLLRQPVLWHCVAVVLAGLAVGWVVVVAESVLAHRRAAAILAEGAPDPRRLARPAGKDQERRAAGLIGANVIAYAESRASAPFVGNGFIVRPWKMDIDIHRRAPDADDRNAGAFEIFDVIAFHEWLDSHFQLETAVESTASRRLTAGHRLYVDGRKLGWRSPLLRDGRPVSTVDWDHLAAELRHGERADDQRVYFYLQEVCRDGAIGICTLVRPLVQGGSLSIEFVPLVLPPVHPDVEALIAELPASTRDHFGRAVRTWTPHLASTVFGAPGRCAKRLLGWMAKLSGRARWRLAARYGWHYDLGAVMSVREGVCWREPDEFDHFVIQDLIRINDHLRDRLVTSIKAYLRDRGIDTGQLDADVRITQIQNWNVGNVRADMVGFGNNNTFGSPGRDAGGEE